MPNPAMPRVPPESLSDEMRAAWEKSMELRGDAAFFEVFAHRPDLYDWYVKEFYGRLFSGGRVERRIKELVRLRLSRSHGCRFCNQGNRADALAAGIGEKELEELDDYENGRFAEGEKAALRLADQIALGNTSGLLSEPLYRALRAHFDDGQILELGLVMGILAGMAKFMFVFDMVEREPACVCDFPSSKPK